MIKQPLLDLSSLQKAVLSLQEVITLYEKDTANAIIRDAMIQRFEYTYELGYKMLKRYLELSEPNAEEVDQMSFPTLIRTASERGLLARGWDQWKLYRDARNITSHTYNEKKAIHICSFIPGFLVDVQYLSKELQARVQEL